MPKKKSETGLNKETAAALSYVLGPLTGVLFFLIEKDPYVRFHAMQSIVVFGVLMILQSLFAATVVLIQLAPLVVLLEFGLWLVLIYKAWQGEKWSVPVLGELSQQLLSKVK